MNERQTKQQIYRSLTSLHELPDEYWIRYRYRIRCGRQPTVIGSKVKEILESTIPGSSVNVETQASASYPLSHKSIHGTLTHPNLDKPINFHVQL